MEFSPLIIAKIASSLGKTVRDENIRRIIFISVLTPFILIILVLSSPFAIFFGIFNDGVEDKSIQSVMVELEEELIIKIDNEKNEKGFDSVEVIYIESEDNTIIDNSVDVLSFFSVLNTLRQGNEVAYFDKTDKEYLEKIFWEMNIIDVEIIERKSTVIATDSNGERYEKEKIKYHKKIYVNSLSAETMASKYGFNENELKVLEEVKMSSDLFNIKK